MKSTLIALLLMAGALSSNASVMISAEPVTAKMDEHFVISLPVDQPLAQVYVIDISALAFSSAEQLNQFCMNVGERVLVVRGNFEEKKLFISPQPDMTDGAWTLADWNTYLSNRAPKMEALYKMLIGG